MITKLDFRLRGDYQVQIISKPSRRKVGLIFISIIFSLATTYYIFRNVLNSILIGEIFDTRLMIIIHEHWFKFLSNERTFLDVQFFFPYDRALGFTDSFFLTGLTHALFRFNEISIINAWLYSQILWTFFGLLGWYFLSRSLEISRYLSILSIPLIGSSYAFITHIHDRPNVIPYLLVSWPIFFYISFMKEGSQNSRKSTIFFGFFLISVPSLVLTSWYPGFFLVLVFIIYFIVSFFFNKTNLTIMIKSFQNMSFLVLTPFLFIAGLLTALWSYIYLPVLMVVGENYRSINEVISTSPVLKEIFVNQNLGGSLLLTNTVEAVDPSVERLIGISPIVFILLLLLLLINISMIKFRLNIDSPKKSNFISLIITFLLIEISIIKFSNNSIFLALWDFLPFLKSIRTPVRWHIIFTFFLIILILFLLTEILKRYKINGSILIILIISTIFLDAYRDAPGHWSQDEFLEDYLINYESELQSCEAFLIDRPRSGWWKDTLEAMALTLYVNKPTVNGHSGGYPEFYPRLNLHGDGDVRAIGLWLQDNDSLESVCIIDDLSPAELPKFNSPRPLIRIGTGFTNIERQKDDFWYWSVTQESEFYIYNLSNESKILNLKFDITSPSCLSQLDLSIKFNGNTQEISTNKKQIKDNSFQIKTASWERVPINIISKSGFCYVEGDARPLHYSLKNIEIVG